VPVPLPVPVFVAGDTADVDVGDFGLNWSGICARFSNVSRLIFMF
jgi:hypothetical protein